MNILNKQQFIINMANTNPSNEIEKLHAQVKKLLSENYTEEAIIETLQQQGLEHYYIETIIENIEDEAADKKSFRNSMIMGGFYIGGGLLINIFSYKIADNANASFFYLFWGVVALGIITIVRGFILYKR
jgi:hypothetical protein